MPAVDAMRACGKGRTGADVMSRAKTVLSQATKVPALGPDAIMTVVTVTITIMVIVMMVMMAIRIGTLIIDAGVVLKRKLRRRIIAPAQLQQRRFLQLPHLFSLPLPEITANLTMQAIGGLALRHLIRVLLLEGLSLASKFRTELVTPVKSLTCIECNRQKQCREGKEG
jgi:hypothetical protein